MSDRRDEPHFLYRVFDDEHALLYVGCTVDPQRRFAEHRSRAPWFARADHVEWEAHPNRIAARRAERETIRREEPEHNLVESLTLGARWKRRRTPPSAMEMFCDFWLEPEAS